MQSPLKIHHDNLVRTHAHLVERRGSRRATSQRTYTGEHVMATLQSPERGEVLCRLMPMRVTDRSAGGLGLVSQQEISPGETISIHFSSRIKVGKDGAAHEHIQATPHPIWHGRVVRCEQNACGESFRVGVESGQRRAA